MSDHNGETKAARPAPYVSWRTVKTLLSDMHDHGVPTRIDRSVVERFSGGVRSQLMPALRFLGLIQGDNLPTERFRLLAKSYGTAEWQAALSELVQSEYSSLFSLDLESATPSHFNETFRKAFPGSDGVLVKCQTFFIQAAQDAGIKIGSRLLAGKKRGPVAGAGRKKAAKKEAAPNSDSEIPINRAGGNNQKNHTPPPIDKDGSARSFEKELLAKFPEFDPKWEDEIKKQWFAGFQQFMALTKGTPNKE